MPDSLADLERRRAAVLRQISELEDFRAGSITGTGGRCGSPGCHCHLPDDPGHRPHPRLTYKVTGKTVTESFATPGEQRKAEREIEAFRRYRQLERSFIEVNERICRVRPVKDALTAEEQKGRGDPGRGRALSKHTVEPYLRQAEAGRRPRSGGSGDGLSRGLASGRSGGSDAFVAICRASRRPA
jgi:hypothetical protein